MRLAWMLAALLALSACGADGPPERKPGGVSVSGEARIGVRGSL